MPQFVGPAVTPNFSNSFARAGMMGAIVDQNHTDRTVQF